MGKILPRLCEGSGGRAAGAPLSPTLESLHRRCSDHAPLIMHHHSPSRSSAACDLSSARSYNRAAAGRRRPRRRRPDAPPTRTNRWRAPARARTAVLGRHAHLLPAARGRLMPRCRCWSGRAGRWRLGRPLHASSRSLERPLVGKSWGDAHEVPPGLSAVCDRANRPLLSSHDGFYELHGIDLTSDAE